MIVILMGVSGSGKTTIGLRLAGELQWRFVDADDLHSPENIRKMASGQPLSDGERKPWLALLRHEVEESSARNENVIIACSALKDVYRKLLVVDPAVVRVVYLKGSIDLIRERLLGRSGHFMKDDLLVSQFATLEEPTDALVIDIDDRPGKVVDKVRAALGV